MHHALRYYYYHNNGGSDPFDPAPYLDLVNLQSINPARFTLSGSQISSWAEEGGTLWSQGTAANRPLLTGGIPIFDGSNDQLIRASEVSATTYSLYVVFRDLGAITKILFGAQSNSDYCMHDSPSGLYDRIQLATGGVTRQGWTAGITGNRYLILNIRRNANTLSAKLTDRTLLAKTINFAGQATPIARLCSIQSAGFFMNAGVKAFCMSSQNLDDTTNGQVIDYLYSTYNLASDTAAECVTCFGDSNTVGQGVTPYAISLGSQLGVADHNLGISGSRLTALDASSGITRWQSQIPTRPYTDYVVIMYGTNDILASVGASTYATALNTIVAGLISAGYSPDNICLVTPPYQVSGQNATALNNYRTEILSIQSTHGVKVFDAYQWGLDNGGDARLTDAVHIDATYQAGIANGVYAAFTA
jgi:lysophospholipase L1-like esterase